MVLFSALTLVGFHELGVPVYLALLLTIGTMILLAFAIERLVLRPMINQPDIILFMATNGWTFFLEGFGQMLWGSDVKPMQTAALGIADRQISLNIGLSGGPIEDILIQKRALTAENVEAGTLAGL